MKFFKEDGVVTGLRLEDPIGRKKVFSHVGEYTSTPRHHIPLHDHETWEFLLQVEGKTSWQQRRQLCTLGPGDLLVCPPRIAHEMQSAPRENFRIYFFGCTPAKVCPELKLEELLPHDRLSVFPGGRRMIPALRSLLEEAFTRQHYRSLGTLIALQRVLLEAGRLVSRDEPMPAHPQHPVVLRLRSLISENPGQRWQLKDIARMAGYAPNYIATLFRKETGQTLHSHVNQSRLEAARSLLLTTDETVTNIALQSGFSSSQHFAMAFQRYFGRTALAVRSEGKKGISGKKPPRGGASASPSSARSRSMRRPRAVR